MIRTVCSSKCVMDFLITIILVENTEINTRKNEKKCDFDCCARLIQNVNFPLLMISVCFEGKQYKIQR